MNNLVNGRNGFRPVFGNFFGHADTVVTLFGQGRKLNDILWKIIHLPIRCKKRMLKTMALGVSRTIYNLKKAS